MRNYGYKPDIQKPEDYVLGGITKLPREILQADKDWTPFLGVKEYQNLNQIEPFACVSFSVLNCAEILIKRKYGLDRNYSDRFLAMTSGTQEGGNSPNAVAQSLHKEGVVLQDVWPFDQSIDSFEKFYSPIPQGIIDLAKEFLDEFDFKYEKVPSNHKSISEALTYSPVLISVSAWFERNGLYYRPEGFIDNHATTLIYEREGEFRRVFDSYADGQDDPALKDVEWEALPQQCMRFWISRKEKKVSWFIRLLRSFKLI